MSRLTKSERRRWAASTHFLCALSDIAPCLTIILAVHVSLFVLIDSLSVGSPLG